MAIIIPTKRNRYLNQGELTMSNNDVLEKRGAEYCYKKGIKFEHIPQY